jgi:hypothetical protein
MRERYINIGMDKDDNLHPNRLVKSPCIHLFADSAQTLLKAVCGLSYRGDIRMGLAEDPHKVGRIVAGSREGLEATYLPLMTGLPSPSQGSDVTANVAAIPGLSDVVQVGLWQNQRHLVVSS